MNFPSSAKRTTPSLSQRIRSARRSAGLSQAALGKRASVTASAVAQWEHPEGTRPGLDRLESIAKATGVPLTWLVSGGPRSVPSIHPDTPVELPAVAIEFYAESLEEEELLRNFRRLSPRIREYVAGLIEALSVRRQPRRIQRR